MKGFSDTGSYKLKQEQSLFIWKNIFKQERMMKRIVCFIAAAVMMQVGAVYAKTVEPIKAFDDVFAETIETDIDDIGYGMVCFPDEGINRAANLENEDLQRLMDAYSRAEGECIIAPEGNYFYDYTSELNSEEAHFYIGVSIKLPEERWTWQKNIKMLRLCFGGEYNGAAIYGGYGIVKSSYGDDYPAAMPVNYVWYKPVGETASEIYEIGNEIYNKYKDIAKPFGDYDGTGDDRYFSGYDGTWDTKFTLPECFTAEGCSEWAYDTLQSAASDGLIPYTVSQRYTEPVTRGEFCELMANLLNRIPYREYDDLFAAPLGYTVLAEKTAETGNVQESISYKDMPQLTESVKYLSALGIVSGVGDNEFDPGGYITREQICTILDRVFRLYPELKDEIAAPEHDAEQVLYNDDYSISSWAYDSVYAMTRYGIMNGTGNDRFEPQGYCTLEQAVTILYRIPHGFVKY